MKHVAMFMSDKQPPEVKSFTHKFIYIVLRDEQSRVATIMSADTAKANSWAPWVFERKIGGPTESWY